MIQMDVSEHVLAARIAAQQGFQPHAILKLLLERMQPRWPESVPRIPIEVCLVKAFNISLREARDIEGWIGFEGTGTTTDQDIDRLLEPWIAQYLEGNVQ